MAAKPAGFQVTGDARRQFHPSIALLVIRQEPAKLEAISDEVVTMVDIANAVPWILGLVVLVAAIFGLRRHFSTEAKEARRRARSHGPVISRKRGPSVRLAVKVHDPKRKR